MTPYYILYITSSGAQQYSSFLYICGYVVVYSGKGRVILCDALQSIWLPILAGIKVIKCL